MKSFAQVAIPHEDVAKGRLTIDVFAADLWQVACGKAPLDYQDPDLFFRKTYMTRNLRNILEIAKARLEGRGGDSIIQLQTPFGGGKTHALIALYHKAREWNAKVVVFDGTSLDPKEVKPWEEVERQLTGKIEITRGDISPGKDKIIKLLSENAPVLILMDEVLTYITKASGVKVGDSNLGAQTLAFIQELTGAVAAVGNSLLVLALPTSVLEHYDENAERAFQQLQKVTGRIEKIYTPVEDEEIGGVIRARLFSRIEEKEVKAIVDDFIEYARREGLLSEEEVANYREKFLKSYPFKPEVVDILYKRWGSFPTFQRTRGVLRLLSLVIHDLLNKNIPFIRLGDFNLGNDEIRRELVKHIGSEWDSIIAQDITSGDSGAKKVDDSLGSSYRPYNLGTVVSTTIFMLSFSGRGERGASIKEIKLSTAHPEFPSTVIDTVISNLRERLFYLSDEGLFFANQPNLNRIIIVREESIPKDEILEKEKEVIERCISRSPKFRVYIHPKLSNDIPDTAELKLVILNKSKPDAEFLEKHGESPRIYRNTLIFLCINENEKETFYSYLRKYLALSSIESDEKLMLTDSQRKEVKNKLKSHEQRKYEELRRYYNKLYLPARDGYREIVMGIPTFGESSLDKEVYEFLKEQGEILEKVSSRVIRDKYLPDKDYIEIKKLYDAFLKTPGEIRLSSKEGFIEGIKEGVKNGLFGFGYISDGKIDCQWINEIPAVNLEDGEIIIKPELCRKEIEIEEKKVTIQPKEEIIAKPEVKEQKVVVEEYGGKYYSKLSLKLRVPAGQISTVARIISYLRSKFNRCAVEVILHASDGKLQATEYENKVIEALNQAGIEVEELDED
ncbi:MAG: AAA family ATPase [Thermoproteota archaeon]|nr:MAG: AAA family ATPase [Candidatus Korarchaeota archaeon]